MEAFIYTFLLVRTIGVIFFAIFFREPPRIIKSFDKLTHTTHIFKVNINKIRN
jgi:photosystem II PsbT protein